jgi:hypothetical protein
VRAREIFGMCACGVAASCRSIVDKREVCKLCYSREYRAFRKSQAPQRICLCGVAASRRSIADKRWVCEACYRRTLRASCRPTPPPQFCACGTQLGNRRKRINPPQCHRCRSLAYYYAHREELLQQNKRPYGRAKARIAARKYRQRQKEMQS